MESWKSIKDFFREVDFYLNMPVNYKAMDLRKQRAQSIIPETI